MDNLLQAREDLVANLHDELVGPGSGEACDLNGNPCSLPDKEHEIITDLPENRYYIGVLYPTQNKMQQDNDTSCAELSDGVDIEIIEEPAEHQGERGALALSPDVSDDSIDEIVALSMQDRPSSIGLSFTVDKDIDSINVSLEFATYRKTIPADCMAPYKPSASSNAIVSSMPFSQYVYIDGDYLRLKVCMRSYDVTSNWKANGYGDIELLNTLYKLAAQCNERTGFKREPHTSSIKLSTDGAPISNLCNVSFANISAVKKAAGRNRWTITVMLYNSGNGHFCGTNSLFQPKLSIDGNSNPHFHILPYDDAAINSLDPEEQSLALLYRNKVRYASGHGVSAKWKEKNGIISVETDLMPETQVPQMDFDFAFSRGVNKHSLSLKFLSNFSDVSSDERIGAMEELLSAYESWIEEQKLKQKAVPQSMRRIASAHISVCETAAKRMRQGIEHLRNNSLVMSSFELANKAMFMQMVHRKRVGQVPEDEDSSTVPYEISDYAQIDKDYAEYIWRPFQAAFLLMSISGLIDSGDSNIDGVTIPDRDIVDIIWFPTGGGKTEAYLAVTAFLIFYRRLRYPQEASGTAILMRYTLRLLTSQQFARASTLICACDMIREELKKSRQFNPLSWKEPITIGLWIGGDHTPNKTKGSSEEVKSAEYYLKKLTDTSGKASDVTYRNDQYNHFQVLSCPWCGASLVPKTKSKQEKWGYAIGSDKHFYLCCIRPKCPFQKKLPIQVVDEELYKQPPTLLFATVDKFAMMPWNDSIGNFFAVNSKNRPPELIIQDELHLISGPLGSIVGLYESAIDSLCSRKGTRPKIIASTATIRRAGEQCRNLYNRRVQQFPPSGLDSDDSFFAKEADTTKKSGRLYVGIFPSGKTKAMLETRVISSLLQRVHMLQTSDEIKDKYWTLVGYFNNLRDLGKCSGLVDDDIKDFMRRLGRRLSALNRVRPISMASELTSRVPTTTLVKRLKNLEKVEYSVANQEAKLYPISVLLATNMISVGVDVDRLNLMTVIGQPKLTSEYIQATSRVGRKYPGLVFTLYDATKSRDRSHYEQFRAYHESFYRFVEPTSVTPFSQPALDRALHAVLISLIRNYEEKLSKEENAKNIEPHMDVLRKVKDEFMQRITEIHNNSESDIKMELASIASQIDEFFASWTDYAASLNPDQKLLYGLRFMMSNPGANENVLLKPYGKWTPTADNARETLTSMRNVDQSLSGRMLIWEEECHEET